MEYPRTKDFEYRVIDGEVHIKQYVGEPKSTIIIPEFIDDMPVVSLCGYRDNPDEITDEELDEFEKIASWDEQLRHYGAFEWLDFIKCIIFPKTLISIGEDSFACCENLKKTGLEGSNVKYVGEGAYNCCESLKTTDIEHSDVIHVGDYAFCACKGLESLDIDKDDIVYIGNNVFEDCRDEGYEYKSTYLNRYPGGFPKGDDYVDDCTDDYEYLPDYYSIYHSCDGGETVFDFCCDEFYDEDDFGGWRDVWESKV